MIEPFNERPIGSATPRRPPSRLDVHKACIDIEQELRQLYAAHFREAHDRYLAVFDDLESVALAEALDLDPAFLADGLASAATKHALSDVVARHLPAAKLLEELDEPAVIDSTWLLNGHEIIVEWDYSKAFGDPNSLTVIARLEVVQ